MKNRAWRSEFLWNLILLLLIASVHEASAQETRFFRIAGPAVAGITAFGPDGTLVWTNAEPGAKYIVQTAVTLSGGTIWVDYDQLQPPQNVSTNQMVAFAPPAGMAFIPAGFFTMGDTLDGETDAVPTDVYVSAFYMDVNLVSYAQWLSVYNWATNQGYRFSNAGVGKAANHPVVGVDWYNAVIWCNARSQQEGLSPVYYTDAGLTQICTNGLVSLNQQETIYVNWTTNGYRLPTEAEWEKAARGGLSGQRFPWGLTISESQANYYGDTGYSYDLGPNGYNTNFDTGGYPYTSPVGYFAPNGYGLFDMAGNVCQWCWDWYGAPYGQPTTSNPTGPASGSYRILRSGPWNEYILFVGGGGYNSQAEFARCAGRIYVNPADADDTWGFRCVRGP